MDHDLLAEPGVAGGRDGYIRRAGDQMGRRPVVSVTMSVKARRVNSAFDDHGVATRAMMMTGGWNHRVAMVVVKDVVGVVEDVVGREVMVEHAMVEHVMVGHVRGRRRRMVMVTVMMNRRSGGGGETQRRQARRGQTDHGSGKGSKNGGHGSSRCAAARDRATHARNRFNTEGTSPGKSSLIRPTPNSSAHAP